MNDIADRLPIPLTVLFAVLIAWTLADGIWFFAGGAETDVGEIQPATPRAQSVAQGVASASEIAAMDLFGRSEGTEVVAIDAPETRLQLELQGVFLAADDEGSSAIVAERNRDGRLYFVGDRLPGNAELSRVLGDRIIIRRGGVVETLRFPEAGAAQGFRVAGSDLPDDGVDAYVGAPDPQPDSLPGMEAQQPESRPDERPESRPDPAAPGRDAAEGNVRELISRYRQRAETDPEGTLRELGLEPVNVGDSQGYRIGSEASADDLARIGLRSGDVVLSVNGREVGELQRDAAAVDGILDSGSARLEIQRGERRFFVTTRIPTQ